MRVKYGDCIKSSLKIKFVYFTPVLFYFSLPQTVRSNSLNTYIKRAELSGKALTAEQIIAQKMNNWRTTCNGSECNCPISVQRYDCSSK